MAGWVRDDDADLCTTLVEPIADAAGTGGAGRVRMARDEDSQSVSGAWFPDRPQCPLTSGRALRSWAAKTAPHPNPPRHTPHPQAVDQPQ